MRKELGAGAQERGTILLVVLMVAISIAALATISTGRVVAEIGRQGSLEDETRAYNQAYAQLHMAMNVVNNAMYDEANHNLVLRAATGAVGIQAAEEMTDEALLNELGSLGGAYKTSTTNYKTGQTDPNLGWLDNPEGVQNGMIPGTTVRVYRGRDYVQRLQKLNGDPVEEVDPWGTSASYFVLEAVGRSGSTIRLVSALVRENEPFSSFVFFQNQNTLGVSGKPRGLVHANDKIAFYFAGGSYVDGVTAVNGFEFTGGATQQNTNIMNGNPSAAPINFENVDFADLKAQANLYVGEEGLDAEIEFRKDGRIRIIPIVPPRWENVEKSYTTQVLVGYEDTTQMVKKSVQVGTETEERERQVLLRTDTETYTVDVPVYEMQDVEYSKEVPVYEKQEQELTREVPIYDTRTVTKTRTVKVFVPYDADETGGGTVAGGGIAGEYEYVKEEYQTEETYVSGYETETYTKTVKVQVGTETKTWTETVQVQTGTTTETRTRDVPVYGTEEYEVEVPVYEDQMVKETVSEPVYENQTTTYYQWRWNPAIPVGQDMVWVKDDGGVIYVDGRIVSMEGDLYGRVTIIANDKVRITGDINYVDGDAETAMLNGDDYSDPYVRNPDYEGTSVLGVIARDDILFTSKMRDSAEVNGTLMSVEGRVGIDGFAIDNNGEPTKNYYYGLTLEEIIREAAYDHSKSEYRTRRFVKDSMRRIGGLISENRIMETYIKPRSDGTAYVNAGFKRGRMMFDINVLFNPPPNFVEIPRPVLINFAPIFLVRNNDR